MSRPARRLSSLASVVCRRLTFGAGRRSCGSKAAPAAASAEPTADGSPRCAAAVLREYDRPLSLELRKEVPKCGEGQVLVKVDSAGLNSSDQRFIAGVHYFKPKLPVVPGYELAGEVVEVGDGVTSFQRGDRVLGLLSRSTGALSELCVVDEHELHALPHSVGYEKALCLPVAYASAYHALANVAKVQEGQFVLVLTSQGATGLAAVDVALNVFRCNVIVASDNAVKLDIARNMGVLATADYMDEKMPAQVRKLTDGKGAHVVVDTVGSFWFDLALQSLRPRGHLLATGFSTNNIPMVSLMDLYKYQVTLSGVWFGGFARSHGAKFSEMIDMLIGLSDEGYISPAVAHTYPLHKINEAIAFAKESKPLGKFVVTCRDLQRDSFK